MDTIRIGIVGLGANTRLRHVPGLRACDQVEICGVCNRTEESSRRAASEFDIPRTYQRWEQLVDDPDLDAVVIGTWPYLHCPITLAALESNKHVLTEARMAMNAEQAREMAAASRNQPDLVTQIVPSPLGLRGHHTIIQMLAEEQLGELREAVVLGTHPAFADGDTPLHWRQSAEFSGINMLALGILHEPLVRWIPHPQSVMAHTQTFTTIRPDPDNQEPGVVGTPDVVHAITQIPGGARGIYHLSAAIHHGPSNQIHLYGSAGTLKYLFDHDQLFFGKAGDQELSEVMIPSDDEGGWRVEEEFINAIRGLEPVRFTTFEDGVRYMEFTSAVLESAVSGKTVPC